MRQAITKKKYLESHGIYPESYNKFIKLLKALFKKREDFLSLTKIREKTGLNAETLKKYLAAAVILGDIRSFQGYYLGCSPYELIIADFGFGDTFSCPSCNKEVLLPSEVDELVCDCGIHYIKQETGKWMYQPRIEYLGNALWKLESLTYPGWEFYEVRPFERYCSCTHHVIRGAYCKHLEQVTYLVANIVVDKIIRDSKSKGTGGLVVIAAALRRWFDHRGKLQLLTYRALANAVEKSGLNLSKIAITRIVSKFTEKQVLSRAHLPHCIEGKTLISLNPEVLKQFLELGKSTIDSYTKSFKVQFPEHKASFLKLDNVEYPDIMPPNSEFALSVDVNYCFPKATPVRLELLDAQSHITLRSIMVRLNGEDITSIKLKLNSLEIQAWVPQVELYCQDDKKEWRLVDHYLAGRRIFAPIVKISKTVAGLYEVESFTQQGKFYEVDSLLKSCSCPAYTYHQSCKHLQMIENIAFSHVV